MVNTRSNYIISITAYTMTTLYPCLFIYFNNAGEASFKDIIGISLAFLLMASVIYLIGGIIFKSVNKAAITTTLVMLFFMNFALIETGITKIFPMLYYWHIILILFFLLLHIGYLIYRTKDTLLMRQVNLIIALAFTGLILLNATMSLPTIFQKMTFKGVEPNSSQGIVSIMKKTPNVYFFLFDEYGGLDCLERYCNYDNSDFLKSLQARGFNISSHSTNNTVSTTVAIPNLLNYSLVNNEEMLESEKRKQLINPAIYTLMRKNGYKINTIDYKNFIDQSSSDFRFNYTGDYDSESASDLICMKTAIYPLIGIKGYGQLLVLNNAFEYSKASSSIQSGNLFTLGYFQFPHAPYFVDADGKELDSFEMDNVKDSRYYLGQVKYLNGKIIDMVDAIMKNDPQSIIIIQSDHGFRQPLHLLRYGIETENLEFEYRYMSSILNGVYYKGEKLDIEGKSGVNTLRMVLNRLFKTDLQMIEEE